MISHITIIAVSCQWFPKVSWKVIAFLVTDDGNKCNLFVVPNLSKDTPKFPMVHMLKCPVVAVAAVVTIKGRHVEDDMIITNVHGSRSWCSRARRYTQKA